MYKSFLGLSSAWDPRKDLRVDYRGNSGTRQATTHKTMLDLEYRLWKWLPTVSPVALIPLDTVSLPQSQTKYSLSCFSVMPLLVSSGILRNCATHQSATGIALGTKPTSAFWEEPAVLATPSAIRCFSLRQLAKMLSGTLPPVAL